MSQGMANTIVSAIVGGIVGAGVVFFAGNKVDLNNVEFENLQVGKLTIKKEAVLLDKDGEMSEVAIRDGSVMAKNAILGQKVIAQQVQGHAIVVNRLLATPDNLVTTPMEQWRFYAEIGASNQDGGEIIARSVNGASLIGKPTTSGMLFRMGYDPEQRPQMLALQNPTRSPMEISYVLSEAQKQMLNTDKTNQQGAIPSSSFDSGSTAPVTQGSTATAPTQGAIFTR